MLSTAGNLCCRQRFYRKLGFVRVWVCCQQAPWTVDIIFLLGESEMISEFISDLNSEFLIFFSSGTPCLYKKGVFLLLLYLVLDWFNKSSLTFCLENVFNCLTSLNSCVLAFFLLFTCSCDLWLFSDIIVLYCWDSNKWYQCNLCSMGNFIRMKHITLDTIYSSAEGKLLIFLIWICFH